MKLSRFWQRQRRDADLQRELDAYIEQETADQIAAGLSPEQARWAAKRKLGNITRIREDVYERNSLVTLETIWRDLLYAARLLRHNPGFATVAILSIALGIGANASVFTLLDQVMLRPLPVERPEELVLLTSKGFQYGGAWGDGNELSYPMYLDLRDHNEVSQGMFARIATTQAVNYGRAGERARAELVSGSYFPVLGVGASRGRVFDSNDDRAPGAHPLVVLSHRYWQQRFQSDVNVVGTTVRLGSHPMTIVGVAQAGFDGTNLGSATEMFIPLAMAEQLMRITNPATNRRIRWLNVFGRLRPGITAEQAQAALLPFYASRLIFEVEQDAFDRVTEEDKKRFVQGSIEITPAAYGKSELRAQLQSPLWILTAIGVGVLLIACSNVANLLLASGSMRGREIAVRLAIGASRRRVIRQLLIESLLLAIVGGALGVLTATWGAQALLAFFADEGRTLTITAWPDSRLLAINVGISAAVGILFGLAPAWQGTRPEVSSTLNAESRGVIGGGFARLRKGLVVAQVALSMLLLVGAGLFVRSLNNLLAIETGFDTPRLLSFGVSAGAANYDDARMKTLAKTLLDRVRATPGVSGAGFVSTALLTGGSWNDRITIEGRPFDRQRRPFSHNNVASPGYFDAMGMRIIAGRDFDGRDEGPGLPWRVAIINEQFAKQFLDGRQPIGLHVGFGANPGTPTPIEIVGVVTTAKFTSVRSLPQPQMFFPFFEAASIRDIFFYVRTAQEPASMVASMRQVVRDVDPMLFVSGMRTVDEQIKRSLVKERFIASLSAVLSVLATLLAMIGLYGVMAHTVARRTREIAIRVAFGAVSARVAGLIVRDMLTLVMAGMAIAVPAYWWLNRYVTSQLYGVEPTDPSTFVISAALLMAAAAAAVWVPSRRALRVNPMRALREE